MIRFIKIFLLTCLPGFLLMCTGCVTLYKPNAIHSPMLAEKGEFNTSASLGASGCGLYNLQAAYGVSVHAGVMMDGMYHNRHFKSGDGSVEKLNMFSGEAGAGYFTPFGKFHKGLFQWYSGGGYGNTTDRIDHSSQPSPDLNAKYFNLFTQPGLAYTSKNLDVAFDVRANYVKLFHIHAYLYDQFEWWNTDFRFYSDTTIDFMNLEPAITFRAGGAKWKGILQLGVTIPTIHSRSYFNVNTSSMLGVPLFKLSLGVSYTLGRKRIKSD